MKLVFALKEVFSVILTIPSFTQLPRRQRNISFRGKILAIFFLIIVQLSVKRKKYLAMGHTGPQHRTTLLYITTAFLD